MAIKYIAVAFALLAVTAYTADARTLLEESAPAPAPAAESATAPQTAPAAAAAPGASAAPASGPTASYLDSVAAAPAVPTQTPAPSGCALSYVQSNSSYSMFASIIYAAPQSSNFSNILGDQMTGITLFLPDNAAVNATLAKKGLDLPGLLKVQSLCEQIIAYHILPSPLEMAAFKEGYSWNTLLNGGADLRDALRVKKSGSTVKIAGGQSTATLEGKVTKVCMDSIFHVSALLLPRNSVTTEGSTSTSS